MRIEDPDGSVIYPPPLPQGSGPVVPISSGTVGYYYPPQQGPIPQQSTQSNPTINIDIMHPDQWGKAVNAGVSASYGPFAGAAAGAAVDVGVSAVKKHAQDAIHYIGRMLGIKDKKNYTPEEKARKMTKTATFFRNVASKQMESSKKLMDALASQGKSTEKFQKFYARAQQDYNYWNSKLQPEQTDKNNYVPQIDYVPQTQTYERPTNSSTYQGSQPVNLYPTKVEIRPVNTGTIYG